jgi:hypothetical protein
LRAFGIKAIFIVSLFFISLPAFAEDLKQPNAAGVFYPDNPRELSGMIDAFLDAAGPEPITGDIFALISPHAGLGYSGQAAAFGYKLIRNKPYKTVVVIGPSHQYGFSGVSVYPKGKFRTPLGDLGIDEEFTQKLLNQSAEVFFALSAFEKEHSIEVQLPFLQKTLSAFKIVPIVMGDCTFSTCRKFAGMLKAAIGERKDVLIIASSDMAHRYDYREVEALDKLTLACLEEMDDQGLYYGFREAKLEMCGIFPVVTAIILAKESGYPQLEVLKYTNSAEVTGKRIKGTWTVGYASCVIGQKEGAKAMFNQNQKKRLLEIARKSIEAYLESGKKLEVNNDDPALAKEMGAFVTLNERGRLRGCIGSLIGREPLYLTVRDMAVEAAVGDPRFSPLGLSELKDVEIEISVLSPLERIDNPDQIQMGRHGVLVRKGFNSGVYLPQVAVDTGWPKEKFLSSLCADKAGLSPDAWKDKTTEIYIFTAEVFSEQDY